VIPKKSLTGDSTERVDTRVLQVIYRVKDQNASLYVGQQMDVYIKTPDAVNPRAKALNPQQDTGNETVELDLVRYFNSLAGWLRGWAKLQEATSCGAKTVDGCRSSRNRRDTN